MGRLKAGHRRRHQAAITGPNILPLWARVPPWAMVLAVFITVVAVVAPWGNYPLNDDWMYAWIAKRFADTGQLKIDMRLAPSLVLQSVLAFPVIRLCGFSHVVLRALTLTLGAGLLLLGDALLRLLRVRPAARLASLLLWVFNPLFLNLSCSFMTEIYGYALAVGGCYVWLRARATAPTQRPLPWGPALLAASLLGASFWTRQLCVLLFAPLWASTAWTCFRRARRDAAATVPWAPLLVSGALCSAIVLAYFPWARAHHSLQVQFAEPLANLSDTQMAHIDGVSAAMTLYSLAMYTAFFALPLMCQKVSWQQLRHNKLWVAGLAMAEFLGYRLCSSQGSSWGLGKTFNRTFPLLTNIVQDNGLGPLTLGDYFIRDAVRPESLTLFWHAIYGALLLTTPVVLAQWLRNLRAFWQEQEHGLRHEACLFGFGLAAGALVVVSLAFREAMFDRYLLGSLFGLWLAGAATTQSHRPPATAMGRLAYVLALAPLSFYTVAGTHDYLRWNDARWSLFIQAQQQGAAATDIEGGYELNGWAMASTHAVDPRDNTGYYPSPRRFNITLTTTPETRTVAAEHVRTWLMKMPPLLLRERLVAPQSAFSAARNPQGV